jgi:hypothetical protein
VSFAWVGIDQMSTAPTSAKRRLGREIRVTNWFIACPSKDLVDEDAGRRPRLFLHLSAQIGAA